MSRLVRSQYSKYGHSHFFCPYCLHGCTRQDILDKHVARCQLHGAQRVKMPEKGDEKGRDQVRFTKIEYQLRLPFIMYADLESILRKKSTCEPAPTTSSTTQHQHHVPCGSCIYVKSSDNRFFQTPIVNFGEDAVEKFLDQVLATASECRQYLENVIPMEQLTQEQLHEFDTATHCFLCNKEFKQGEKGVKDHDHLTGKYRGAAHNKCNLNYRIKAKDVKIPCVIHNLRGYDAHLILSAAKPHHGEITCIPNNMEKYCSFTIGGVTFIDSCQFMMSPLDKLANNLSPDQFRETRRYLESMYRETSSHVNNVDDMQMAEDYRNHPFIPPTLNEQQQ